MIVSKTFEITPLESAVDNMAKHVADRLRRVWLENVNAGNERFEDNFYEEVNCVKFLSEESFPHLQGIDYIFRWWGNRGEETSGTSGQLEVLWKLYSDKEGETIRMFTTYIYFSDYDLELGTYETETEKREVFRGRIVAAFKDWEKIYKETF